MEPELVGIFCGHAYVQLFSRALETALKLKTFGGTKRQHVHGCSLVRAKKFYGFHSSEELFIKIYLYYPQEVARAASLLLGGSVLNQTFQPYESHFPYFLQFLVDYNLYGMGLVHLAEVKFRHPLPVDFIPSEARYGGLNYDKSRLVGAFPSFQEDPIAKDGQYPTIWLSSNIPCDRIWPFLAIGSNAYEDKNAALVKRQSTCELEGDATVDVILNQQFKMYTPLSQIGSEAKMVQSLVPIWEEEYKRSGIQEALKSPDPNRPSPESVLKTLTHGVVFENAFSKLCTIGQNSLPQVDSQEAVEDFIKFVKPLTDSYNMDVSEAHVHFNLSHGESLACHSIENKSASRSTQVGDVIASKEMDVFHGSTPIYKEMISNGMIETSNTKDVNSEALVLLEWLASFQAMEDLSTDDELVHEVILSPLLPATIDEVLEKAHAEYESASQQECQDILDSVEVKEDDTCFVNHMHSVRNSLENTIPQGDGSADDQFTTRSDSSSDMKNDMERSHALLEDAGEFLDKPRRNRKFSGSLSFTSKLVHEISESAVNSASDIDDSKVKIHTRPSSSALDEMCERYGVVSDGFSKETGSSVLKQGKTLSNCSLRDLMRRKRCYQAGTFREASLKFKKVSHAEQKEETCPSPKCRSFRNVEPPGSRCVTSCARSLQSDLGQAVRDRNVGVAAYISGEFSGVSGSRSSLPDFSRYGKLLVEPGSNGLPHAGVPQDADMDFEGKKSGQISEQSVKFKSEWFGTTVQPCLYDLSVGTSEPFKLDHQDACTTVSKRVDLDSSSLNITKSDSESRELDVSVTNELLELDEDNNQFVGHELKRMQGFIKHAKIDSVDADILQIRNSTGSGEITMQSFSPDFTFGRVMEKRNDTMEYILLTFSNKPPIDLQDWFSRDASLVPVVYDHFLDCEDHIEGKTGSFLDKHPTFLSNSYALGKEFHCISSKSWGSHDFYQELEPVLGISTHYQNDGSFLYLLTPACSPPSLGSVCEWLTQSAEQNATVLPTDSFFHLKDADVYTEVIYDGALHQPSSLPDGKPDLEQPILENYDNFSAEKIIKLQSKGNNVKDKGCADNWHELSQISGPDMKSHQTPVSQTGFRDPASVGAGQQLTILSIEVLAESRGDLQPDPRFDAISVIALALQRDSNHVAEDYLLLRVDSVESCPRNLSGLFGCKVLTASEEQFLFDIFMNITSSIDPDILMGWEVQGSSIGFLAERAAHLGISLLRNISRAPFFETKAAAGNVANFDKGSPDNEPPDAPVSDSSVIEETIIDDEWGRTHASGVHVGGRIVLNIWRIMRSEIKLNMYSVEAVAEAVLRRKIPSFSCGVLTKWFSSGCTSVRFRCIQYVVERARINLELMNQLDMINRTSELARVFGVDFFSVLSRGSQYRVESMLLRLAHSQNYLALSPGSQQVASQPAMECLPLVLEPESGFYPNPVVVLDFQSLYPSMIIAYNLCYSTCLGSVAPSKANILGVSSYLPDAKLFMDLKDDTLLTPNGVLFVSSRVRKGVLPRLLEEILSTRIMVKQAMKKLLSSQRVMHKILDARQLALKLIANVTYGYTAAGFSGRMPCAELADSIVQCGRRTLENAISYINRHDKWNACVIYGDTDSMFVLLKGRTRADAFRIGQEIASEVTAMNPHPVTLKMEKVYHPCVLLTKKRYVGYSYESPDQIIPLFDAKGIETVRRDTCPAVAKILERSLRIFFERQELSCVKEYLQRQWSRILSGRVSIQDFVFSKEVRLGTYRASNLPPAALVATKAMKADPRAEPRYGERITYVVIHGEPGARLIDMVVEPLDLLDVNSPHRLNDLYYINKQIIPALQRVFGLLGADLTKWFSEVPRLSRPIKARPKFHESKAESDHDSVNSRPAISRKAAMNKRRIDYYYISQHCTVCGEVVKNRAHICDDCSKKKPVVAAAIVGKASNLEREIQHLLAICTQCGGGDWVLEGGVKCTSLACSVFYERQKVQKELRAHAAVAAENDLYPKSVVEWF